MDIKIPFESVVKFKTNCCEITKMSLEHEFTINNDTILGNFIISGDYRSHEISVNKDDFNYVLPFQVELNDNINLDTIELDIDDFAYEIVGNDSLKINIVYNVKADLKEEIEFERVDEEELVKELDNLDDLDLETDYSKENVAENFIEEDKEKIKLSEDRKVSGSTQTDIINSISDEESYVTYHIHMVKENETLESISALYKINLNVLKEYNEITELNIGDKVLIPFDNE